MRVYSPTEFIGFKIFELKNDLPYTLFHGINKSRQLQYDIWYEADVKRVRDGGNSSYYWSGFHLFSEKKLAIKYLSRFKQNRHLIVLPVLYKISTVKPTNDNVILAKHIKIINES